MLLNRSAAGDPGVGRARLDNHLPAASELDGYHLRQVPRTEQHAHRTRTEMAVAPVSKEGVIGHGDQYPPSAAGDAADDKTHSAANYTWEPPSVV
jgi:hypothetical protein